MCIYMYLSLLCKVCSPVPELVGVLFVSLLQLVVLLLGQHHLLLILGVRSGRREVCVCVCVCVCVVGGGGGGGGGGEEEL